MGITEIFRRIWLLSANKMNSSKSFSNQHMQRQTQLIFAVHNCHKKNLHGEISSAGYTRVIHWRIQTMWGFDVNFFDIPSNSIFIKKAFASNMAIFNAWKIISVSFAASVDKSLTFFGAWVVMKSSTDISAWTSFLKKQSNLTHFLSYTAGYLITGCSF